MHEISQAPFWKARIPWVFFTFSLQLHGKNDQVAKVQKPLLLIAEDVDGEVSKQKKLDGLWGVLVCWDPFFGEDRNFMPNLWLIFVRNFLPRKIIVHEVWVGTLPKG